MGRTNGKLVNFMKEALHMGKYINLAYDSKNPIQFELDLPRFEKNMKAEYEIILKDWFAVNHRPYVNYSNGKSVLKAAMKKSPYIISMKPVCKKLQFRFSSQEEIEEKRQHQKEIHAEHYKTISKEEMPPSVASSGYISGHDNSPEPFEAHDQLKDSNLDNAVDSVVPLWNDYFLMGTMNDSSDENMEINDDELGKEECNDLNDLFKNISAYDVSLQYDDSLLVHFPLHADQSSVEAKFDSGTLNNLESIHGFPDTFNDALDLSEVPIKSEDMAPDQSLSAGLDQPESAIETSVSSSKQTPEDQNMWICFDKKHIGPIVEYICMPMNLTSLAKADSAYQIVPIIENAKNTSCVFISITDWESDRTKKQHMVISDGKYLVIFYE